MTQQQSNQFNYNYANGASLLWTNNYRTATANAITVNFGGNGVSAAGAQIESDVYGIYTAKITAYDANGHVLQSYTEIGASSMGNGNNTAIFLGIASTTPDIYSISFSILNQVGDSMGNVAAQPGYVGDMILGNLFMVNSVDPTPAPPAGLMGILGAATGLLIWRVRGRRVVAPAI